MGPERGKDIRKTLENFIELQPRRNVAGHVKMWLGEPETTFTFTVDFK